MAEARNVGSVRTITFDGRRFIDAEDVLVIQHKERAKLQEAREIAAEFAACMVRIREALEVNPIFDGGWEATANKVLALIEEVQNQDGTPKRKQDV